MDKSSGLICAVCNTGDEFFKKHTTHLSLIVIFFLLTLIFSFVAEQGDKEIQGQQGLWLGKL